MTQHYISEAYRGTYQGQIPLQGQKEVWLPHILQHNHVFW